MNSPIQDLAAERALLGACLADARALAEVSHVASSDFADPAHGKIFQALKDVAAACTPTVRAVVDELEKRGDLVSVGGLPYLLGLRCVQPRNAVLYAQIVVDCARRRRGEPEPPSAAELLKETLRLLEEMSGRARRGDA